MQDSVYAYVGIEIKSVGTKSELILHADIVTRTMIACATMTDFKAVVLAEREVVHDEDVAYSHLVLLLRKVGVIGFRPNCQASLSLT